MAYDGSTWDEANPTNNTLANEIDDVARDIKIGVRSRMDREHKWPSAQSATNEAALHRYITFSSQAAAPDLVVGTNTQVGALYVTTGSLVFINSASNKVAIISSGNTGVSVIGAVYSSTGKTGDILIGSSSQALRVLAGSTEGYMLASHGTTSDPTWISPAPKVTQGTIDISSVGVKVVNGLSFAPQMVHIICGSTGGVAAFNMVGFLSTDGAFSAENHSDNSNWAGGVSASALVGKSGNGSPVVFQAALNTMTADGFSINVATADVNAVLKFIAIG